MASAEKSGRLRCSMTMAPWPDKKLKLARHLHLGPTSKDCRPFQRRIVFDPIVHVSLNFTAPGSSGECAKVGAGVAVTTRTPHAAGRGDAASAPWFSPIP